jgi:hypothetical protein
MRSSFRIAPRSEVETVPDPRGTLSGGHQIRPDARRGIPLKVEMRRAPWIQGSFFS